MEKEEGQFSDLGSDEEEKGTRPWRPAGRGQTVEHAGATHHSQMAMAGIGRGSRPDQIQLTPGRGSYLGTTRFTPGRGSQPGPSRLAPAPSGAELPKWTELDVVGDPEEPPVEGPSDDQEDKRVVVYANPREKEREPSPPPREPSPPPTLWTGPRSGVVESAVKTSGKDSRCPVMDCPVWSRSIRTHVFREHLSAMFREEFLPSRSQNKQFHEYRGHMVIVLARWFCGDEVTYPQFIQFLRDNVKLSKDCAVPQRAVPALKDVCQVMGWEECTFSLHPISSPVLVLYWRVMAVLLGKLTESQRELVWNESFDAACPVRPSIVKQANQEFLSHAKVVAGNSQPAAEKAKLGQATGGPKPEDLILMPAGSEGDPRLREPIRVDPPAPRKIRWRDELTGELDVEVSVPATPPARDESTGEPSMEVSVPATPPETKPAMAILIFRGNRILVSAKSTAELRRLAATRFNLRGRAALLLEDGLEVDDSVNFTDLGQRPEFHVRERPL